ncbi:MAG TPA: hypothetical protein EYP58_02075 [bacterium (Candidatus Stahlbacteria)]|nr:hypothetical protein [Candidatus Stahlbacteria bacterium]
MRKTVILKELREIAEGLSVSIIFDRLNGQGGYCRLRDQHYIIINNSLSIERKIEMLIDCLGQFPLDQIYIKPRIREIIEKSFASSPQ